MKKNNRKNNVSKINEFRRRALKAWRTIRRNKKKSSNRAKAAWETRKAA